MNPFRWRNTRKTFCSFESNLWLHRFFLFLSWHLLFWLWGIIEVEDMSFFIVTVLLVFKCDASQKKSIKGCTSVLVRFFTQPFLSFCFTYFVSLGERFDMSSLYFWVCSSSLIIATKVHKNNSSPLNGPLEIVSGWLNYIQYCQIGRYLFQIDVSPFFL